MLLLRKLLKMKLMPSMLNKLPSSRRNMKKKPRLPPKKLKKIESKRKRKEKRLLKLLKKH